jgi:3-methyladenine DNA glycosylase/8-oxoguanine DNA glycosylase
VRVPVELRPHGPFSLRVSARAAGDATRRWDGPWFAARLGSEVARAAQRADGTIVIAAESDEGVERMRFMLALDDDHSEFRRRFSNDPFLGRTVRVLAGYRPLRTATVAQAVLRAVAAQLIQARHARAIERRITRAVSAVGGPLAAPPTAEALGRFAPVELCRHGLSARKAAAVVRLCRTLPLEELRARDGDAVAARLERERGIGPWSIGVIFLEGLGRFDRGLVGDLGLVKLLAAMRGRYVEGWETAELLEPYGEWAGLASVYMLAGWHRGLLPVPRDEFRRLREDDPRLAAA